MWIYILCGFIILGIIDFIIRKIGNYFHKKNKEEDPITSMRRMM